MDIKRILKISAIFIALFLYALIFGEIYLRLFNPIPILPRYVCSTEFGIRGNVPQASYWHKTAEYKINIRTNSKGIRSDREFTYEKPAGVKRIVVLGDSFGMGYEADLKDTFLYIMEESLMRAGKDIEVINLSVSGYGNSEELIMLRHEGLKYDPDLVLVIWQETDFEDNIRSDLFTIKDGQLVEKSKEYLPAMKTRELLDKLPVYRRLESESNLYCWVREAAAKTIKRLMVNLRNKDNKAEVETKESEPRISMYSKQLVYLLLKEIEKQAASAGAQTIILDVPLYDPKLGAISLLPEECSKEFQIVSVLDQFRLVKNERLFWDKSHWHFTPRTNGIVGRYLAAYILSNDLI